MVAAHAAGGCITSVAGGGGCSSGAASAAFGKFTTIQTQDWGVGIAQGTAAAVAGGVGSVIAGGKFENGAVTAAYGYLFNHLVTDAQSARGLFDNKALRGHHWIAFDSLKGLDISEDALRFWGGAKSGATVAGEHLYDAAHIAYNRAVTGELHVFANAHNIDLSKMTTDQARAFTNHILSGANNPTIKGYVAHISASVAARAAAIGSSQAGRIAGGALKVIGGAGATLLFHTGDLR